MADLALQCLSGQAPFGNIHCYDGRSDQLRVVAVPPRADCPLCGVQRLRDVRTLDYARPSF
jgi:hypothetical protein